MLCHLPVAQSDAAVRLLTPSSYVPGSPFPVRVEVVKDSGARDGELWDAQATLTPTGSVTLSTNRVQLRNGIGTALVSLSGDQDFQLSATVNNESSSTRAIRSLRGAPLQTVSGPLTAASHVWTGIVRVTGDVTVPAGGSLRIAPGAWVLFNGVASGTSGARLIVNGSLNSAGTESDPVVLTCVDPNLNWGQVVHQNSAASEYNWTYISKAGRATGEGHTGTGPAIRPNNSTLIFRNSVISDLTAQASTVGKVMMASGSDLTFENTVFARARMGPEIQSTALLLDNCFVSDMTGPDDSDGIYLHSAGNRTLRVRNSVFAGGTDDAIDTLDANVTIDNCILRDWPNPAEDAKAISVFHGEVNLSKLLIANCYFGVSAKSSGPLTTVRLDHSTISAINTGVSATFKDNAAAGNIAISVTNSIIRANDSINSDFGPEKFVSVSYNILGEAWPGAGNLVADPLFVSPSTGNFRLAAGSPAIDAGSPAYPLDPDGSRTDIGYFGGASTGASLFAAITSPQSGATFSAPATVGITAAAAAAVGKTITALEIFADGTSIGTDTTAPYGITWSPARLGEHTLLAIATDSANARATSAPVSVTINSGGPTTNLLIQAGSEWKFLDDGSDQGAAWTGTAFNDTAWRSAKAEFGYGDGDEVTIVSFGPSSSSKYPTTYFRKTINIDNLASIESFTASLLRDDGAIVYVNGVEAYRVAMPSDPVNYRTYATAATEYGWEDSTIPKTLFRTGANVIAVEVHQGNANSSDMSFDFALSAIVNAPKALKPVAQITAPTDGLTVAAPANLTISASANDFDGSIQEVRFAVNGVSLGTDATAPYTANWQNIPAGDYTVQVVAVDDSGLQSDPATVRVTVSASSSAPQIVTQSPPAGRATNLTAITVTFSKPVIGVDASDLLVNGIAAAGVQGSNSSYTFTFRQPAGDTATITWASDHGIRDTFTPPQFLAAVGWTYSLVDTIAPEISSITPERGGVYPTMPPIMLQFSEPVQGLQATDLLMNNQPASALTGSGAGPYTFTFSNIPPGSANVTWALSHGVTDFQNNPLQTVNWAYTIDPRRPQILISEVMYHHSTERDLDEWIEIANVGSEPVNLAGWRLAEGVEFVFPDISLPSGGFLVVTPNIEWFRGNYSGIPLVFGPWTGHLSNTGEDIVLHNAAGEIVDVVRYADEGDWATRQRGPNDRGYRGWKWHAAHDGEGKSLELVNPAFDNGNGQNWASSLVQFGTPGRQNSVHATNIAPLISQVFHSPATPTSSQPVTVTARVRDEADLSSRVTLYWRVDSLATNAWSALTMMDDGLGSDIGRDGVHTASIPPQPNNTVVEFYVEAVDSRGNTRTWPAPAIAAPDNIGPAGQVANALYQVDDAAYSDTAPLFKLVLKESERLELNAIYNNAGGAANSDAQMNATFISVDGSSTEVKYLTGVRNRGHGTRTARPNNARVNFRSDDRWKGVAGINLNAQYSWLQTVGAAINLDSKVPGAYSRLVRFRINNNDPSLSGGLDRTYGYFAANEVINADWADNHFPNDSDGNIYRAIRDISPSDFDYRTQAAYPGLFGPEDPRSYINTWSKESNVSQDDWTDLFSMLRVFGLNGTDSYTVQNLERVINVDEWLRHLAVMNLLGNSETGLNSGYNDDYFMYRGVKDPRFVLMYYDLDQILGYGGSFGTSSSIFSAGSVGPSQGSGAAFGRFLAHPEIQPRYYRELRDLLNTSFSEARFNSTVDQALTGYVPDNVRASIKNWMASRRTYVLSQLPAGIPDYPPRAFVIGAPRARTPRAGALLQVTGEGVTHYRYSLNGSPFLPETPATTPIQLATLSGTNTLRVIARTATSPWQSESDATTVTWVVDPAWPGVRLNEILAKRTGGLPDQIELYNEGSTTVSLQGMYLSDDPARPFRAPLNVTSIGPGEYIVLTSSHIGFALSDSGEDLRLNMTTASGPVTLDSVVFGKQITDLSIGRSGQGGEWYLNQPTLGRANILQPTALPTSVRINEWLAVGLSPNPDDFIELFNPDSLPVNVGGLFLTDRPLGSPEESRISPLTFIEPNGYATFYSGNGNSSDEVTFGLAADLGEIGLVGADGKWIDHVLYGAQKPGISMGLCPDGTLAVRVLPNPTPGAQNICPAEPPAPQLRTLLAYTNTWKYEASGADLGLAWKDLNYPDSSWSSGPGLLGFETDTLAEPIRTSFPEARGITTAYFRTSFDVPTGIEMSAVTVSHFIDDGAAFYLNGEEIQRYNLPPGATANTLAPSSVGNANAQSFTIAPSLLRSGRNVLAVEVHQSSTSSTDLVLGVKVDAVSYTNSPGAAGIVINEVLAQNTLFPVGAGKASDWLELHNPSSTSVDLAGMMLSTQLPNRTNYVFPSGAIIPAKGYYLLACDSSFAASLTNSGFDLSANGGAIYLFEKSGALRNGLVYGLQAANFSLGSVPDGSTNLVLNLPTPGAANRASPMGDASALKVNEWLANPMRGEDWIELANTGSEPVEISLFGVSDTMPTPLKHRLPKLSYLGIGEHAFLRLTADENLELGADHVGFKLSAAGEAVVLSDAQGRLIDAVTFGPQALGVASGLLPDGATNVVLFPSSSSPGKSNYLPLEDIVINEILTHTDPPEEDTVEIRNLTATPVNIGGWFLSDSGVNLRKYQVPANTIVPAHGYILLKESQFNSDQASEKFAFSSSKGETVFLSQAIKSTLTGHRAAAEFGASFNGVSFGRMVTSQGVDYAATVTKTLGAANSAPRISPVIISEIMYHPMSTNDLLEFVELRNVSNAPVKLFDEAHATNCWQLAGGVEFTFPSNTSIGAGETIVIVPFDPVNDVAARDLFTATYTGGARLFGPFTGKLDNTADEVRL